MVDGEEALLYICEIPQANLNNLIDESVERDHEYGLIIEDPTKVPHAPVFTLQPKDTIFDLARREVINYISVTCLGECGWWLYRLFVHVKDFSVQGSNFTTTGVFTYISYFFFFISILISISFISYNLYISPRSVIMHCSPPNPHSWGLSTSHLHLVQGELWEWGHHGTPHWPSQWPTIYCLRWNTYHQQPKAGAYTYLILSFHPSSYLGCVIQWFLISFL